MPNRDASWLRPDLALNQFEIVNYVGDIRLNGLSVIELMPLELSRAADGWGWVVLAKTVADPALPPHRWIDGQTRKNIYYGWIEVTFSMIPIRVTTNWATIPGILADVQTATGLTLPLPASTRLTCVRGKVAPSEILVVDALTTGAVMVHAFSVVPPVASLVYLMGLTAL